MKFVVAFLKMLKELSNIFQTLVKLVFLSRWRVKLPGKKGESIAFFANGPSLGEAMERMKADGGLPANIMVSNYFAKTDLYTSLQPNFYIVCDPTFLDPGGNPDIADLYRQLYAKTSWPVDFLVPFSFLKKITRLVRELGLENKMIRLTGYNAVNFNGDNRLNYVLFKWKLGIPRPTTVAAPALMMCLGMGYKHIRIAGIDLNQHQDISVDMDGRLMLKSVHFYTKEPVRVPFYRNRKMGIMYSVSDIFLIFHYFFFSFDIVAKFARREKAEILNYSRESFLDQFKKV